MRILMLSPHQGVRGPLPKHTPLLVEALQALGCEVVSEPWGRHTDTETAWEKISGRIRDVAALRARATAVMPDVLVVKTSLDPRALARDIPLLAAVRKRIPTVVVQFHGGSSDELLEPGHRLFKAAARTLFGLADAVLVLSEDEAEAGRRFYSRGMFHVVLNPFDAAPAGNGRATADDGGTPTLLFASRVMVEKGILETIDALAEIRSLRPCRLVVAGDGPGLPEARARVRLRGVEEDVTFAGHVDRERMAGIYASADVFVLPTYWAEGFPTAISEAMSAGLPVVTTKRRGMADHLYEGRNAVFVPPRDAAALARSIVGLLDDAALRRMMGAANREKVQDFAPPAAAAVFLGALEQARAGRRA